MEIGPLESFSYSTPNYKKDLKELKEQVVSTHVMSYTQKQKLKIYTDQIKHHPQLESNEKDSLLRTCNYLLEKYRPPYSI